MKLIHCADFHLDSALNANLDGDRKRLRKAELLQNFVRIVEYAHTNKADAIIIAGDLFDGPNVSAETANVIKTTITRCKSVNFLYLKGNHDAVSILEQWENPPANFMMFGTEWTYFGNDSTVITGITVTKENASTVYDSLILEKNCANIVVMHGQTEKYRSADVAETISLQDLKNKNIDYLALGHIHSYHCEPLDSRGVYCYCGTPEGRGFDECGEKGFVWIETTKDGKLTHKFVPFAKRMIREVKVDITGLEDTASVENKIRESLQGISGEDMVKVSLKGKVSMNAECNKMYLTKCFEPDYFAFTINNRGVGLAIHPEEYENDISLRGEFIRLVMAGNYTEGEKRILSGRRT